VQARAAALGVGETVRFLTSVSDLQRVWLLSKSASYACGPPEPRTRACTLRARTHAAVTSAPSRLAVASAVRAQRSCAVVHCSVARACDGWLGSLQRSLLRTDRLRRRIRLLAFRFWGCCFVCSSSCCVVCSCAWLCYTPENEHFGIVPVEAMHAGQLPLPDFPIAQPPPRPTSLTVRPSHTLSPPSRSLQ
jgi:hypothetical protein